MSRLLGAELRRFFARPIVLILLGGMVLLAGVQLVGMWQAAQPPSAAEEAEAQVYYEEALADWEENGEEYVADCLEGEAAEQEATGRDVDWGCTEMEPRLENYLWLPEPLTVTLPPALASLGTTLFAIGLAVGATFTAAEFATGSMSTWLTFTPRRTPVHASKLLAAALGVVPAAVVALAVFVPGTWAVHEAADLTGGMGAAQWVDAAGTAGRTVALTALGSLLGSALGFLLRHTAGVLGLALGWLLIVENMLGSWQPDLYPWLLAGNIDAFAAGGTTWYRDVCEPTAEGLRCTSVEEYLSLGHGAVYLLAVTALVAVVSLLVFRRRDVA